VEAPNAVSVAVGPLHIVDEGLTLIATVSVDIVIKPVAVLVQPLALVPVTV
jgi:hypothetical protein